MNYGLIGYPLSHSFSKRYFTEKFSVENIKASYELFELYDIQDFLPLLKANPTLMGLNVTIPYKKNIIPYLTRLASSAERVGAVNTIKVEKDGTLTGHNTDYIGFRDTLQKFIKLPFENKQDLKALVLGNGGAGKAAEAVLEDLKLPYTTIARKGLIKFEDVTPEMVGKHTLIINTTPIGMYPNIMDLPAIPYMAITPEHFVYDLIYNPEETLFLQKARRQGAKTINGLQMLHAQAEEAWKIFGT